jgi:intracellular multiplication protein IcmJ
MSQLLNIGLTCTPGAWRLFSARKSDPKFKRFADHVYARDEHTCQFCGFRSLQCQEVVNLDQNYRNNVVSNMVTACCFCAQCFFIDAVGKSEYGGGNIIYLPEMTQAELNGLCHALFCAMANNTPYSEVAESVLRDLKMRSQEVDQHIGDGMSIAANLGLALMDVRTKNHQKFNESVLSDLRLLPSRSRFKDTINLWLGEAVDHLAEQQN